MTSSLEWNGTGAQSLWTGNGGQSERDESTDYNKIISVCLPDNID